MQPQARLAPLRLVLAARTTTPNDRFFMVLSGTWWMGSWPEFKPQAKVPMPAAHVIPYAKGVHCDGAKDEPVTILVWGEGRRPRLRSQLRQNRATPWGVASRRERCHVRGHVGHTCPVETSAGQRAAERVGEKHPRA